MISTNTEEEYSLANNKLGMESSDPPSSSLGLEPRHPILFSGFGTSPPNYEYTVGPCSPVRYRETP